MLDERGDILFPADLTVATLDDAIRHAFDILRTTNAASSSQYVSGVEIWSGTSRLFPPGLDEKFVAGRHSYSVQGTHIR
jgi:hypothetical protein